MSSTLSLDSALSFVTVENASRLLVLWLGYRLLLALYNISPFHPLYKFPGPKLAAASYLYECWYDMIKVGKYTHEIRAMHEKYGPIVRINPDELHCDDYQFMDEIYPSSTSRIRDKHRHFLNGFAGTLMVSSFCTIDHETHKIRRSGISRFFTRQSMLKYEPEIHAMAQRMCTKLLEFTGSGEIVNILDPLNCFTADAISQYAFGEPFGFLDKPDFDESYKPAFESLVATTHYFRHMPILRNLVMLLPTLGPYLGRDIAFMVKSMNEIIPGYITKAQQQQSHEKRVFAEIMDAPIPDEHKSLYRLSGEGWSMVAAGSETTAAALTNITYFLLSQPDYLARLREELKNENPQKLSWVQLEKYPLLRGIIFEALRVGTGIPGRLPRIARDEDLVYNNRGFRYIVPRGTAIGMSAFSNHFQEDIFADAENYAPERWIDAQGKPIYSMERYIMSFGKGTRQCIGIHLAFCELYLVTAALALRVLPQLKLHDTIYDRDVKFDFDSLTPQPKKGSRGVRVVSI
jgi:cytochrome P450